MALAAFTRRLGPPVDTSDCQFARMRLCKRERKSFVEKLAKTHERTEPFFTLSIKPRVSEAAAEKSDTLYLWLARLLEISTTENTLFKPGISIATPLCGCPILASLITTDLLRGQWDRTSGWGRLWSGYTSPAGWQRYLWAMTKGFRVTEQSWSTGRGSRAETTQLKRSWGWQATEMSRGPGVRVGLWWARRRTGKLLSIWLKWTLVFPVYLPMSRPAGPNKMSGYSRSETNLFQKHWWKGVLSDLCRPNHHQRRTGFGRTRDTVCKFGTLRQTRRRICKCGNLHRFCPLG